MTVAAALFLAVCVVAGFGITYLSGLPLMVEERVFFGAVIGLMVGTGIALLLSQLLGLGVVSVMLSGVLTAVTGAAGLALGRVELLAELRDLRKRWAGPPTGPGHPWALWLLLAVSWTFILHFLSQAYVFNSTGLYAGYINIWGDWAAHLAYAGSFAYGDNRPPEFPIDPGHRLGYPFGIDFLAATLVQLGVSLPSGLVLSTAALGLAFPGVMYCAGARLIGSTAAAALAVLVFALQGGTGFIYALADIDQHGLAGLGRLPREYTLDRELGYQWLNPVLAYLVPQRSVLFGFSLALISASLLWMAKDQRLRRPFLVTGVLVGLAPIFHVHGYGTAVALAAFWALLDRRREWVYFLVPAVVLGAPVVVWLLPEHGASLRLMPGWLAFPSGGPSLSPGDAAAWAWFWLKNTALFIPLLLAGQFWRGAIATSFQRYFAPMWLWFAVPNFVILQPWDWDNTKFFVFWALFGSLLVAAVLVRLARHGFTGAVLAAVCLTICTLAGGLDLYRASNFSVSSVQFTDARGVQVAAWVRQHTETRAIFLVAPEHNQPVASLGGRRVVIGYPGWLWTYGLGDYQAKVDDVEKMLRGDPQTPELLHRYGVGYVVIGPQEMADPRRATFAYWDQAADQLYSDGEYRVYRVR